MSTTELIEKALQLPLVEKFILVDSLIQSLNNPDEAVSQVWLEEAERRLKAYREGRLEGIPAEEIFGGKGHSIKSHIVL